MPRELGAGRARGHPSLAPGPPGALTAAASSSLCSPQLPGPSEPGRGLEKEPQYLAPWAGRRGRGIGPVGLGLGGPEGSVVCWVQIGAAGCRPGDLVQER